MLLTFKPSTEPGMVDVFAEGANWNGIDGLADRYALYGESPDILDDWRDSVREYVADSPGWRIVGETSNDDGTGSIIVEAGMSDLILTRGIPGSGKTTWARGWVAEDPERRARVNRDDLRLCLYGRPAPLPRELEVVITVAQHAAVRRLLAKGISVAVDDTNLHLKFVRDYVALAAAAGATVHLMDFDTPVEECIRRDEARIAGRVGEEIIRKMHERWRNARTFGLADIEHPTGPYVYVPDERLPSAWIFDLDGTLATMSGRSPYEWDRVGEDAPNPPAVALAHALHASNLYANNVFVDGATNPYIVVLSGRDAVCRPQTEEWLLRHKIPWDVLLMRPEGDTRQDAIVKLEIFRELVAPAFRVIGVVDDRQQVVDMWRRIGLFCAQVAPGDF